MNELPPLVLLSAGKSSRLGVPKGLYPMGDKTWLEWQIQQLNSIGIPKIVLVLGFAKNQYLAHLPDLEKQVVICVNEQPERGMFSSVQTGLKELAQHRQVLLMPIDTPCPSPEVWRAICNASTDAQVVIPSYGRTGGHPVLLRQQFLQTLLAANPSEPDSRLDFFIAKLGKDQVTHIECDDVNVIRNLNTPDNFAEFTYSK